MHTSGALSVFTVLFQFAFINGVDVSYEFIIGTEGECAGSQKVLREPEGLLITPPVGAEFYRSSCEWTITLDSTDSTIPLELKFESFNLGSGDIVHISDAQFENSVIDMTYSQNNPPDGSTFRVQRYVQVKFMSNNDGNVGLGFKLYWNRILPELTTLPGLPADTIYRDVYPNRDDDFIQSPNHPGNYPVNIKLYYLLRSTSPGRRVEIQFTAFKLSIDDTLTIYDGNLDVSENERRHFTGYKTTLPNNLVSNSDSLLVVFYSSPVVAASGFKIEYRIYVEKEVETTTEAEQTPQPLTPEATAGIIVSVVLIALVGIILAVYFLHYRPKLKREERKIAREMYEADIRQSKISPEDFPKPRRERMELKEEPGQHIASTHAVHSSLWITANQPSASASGQRPTSSRPTTAGRRPGSAAAMVKTGATFNIEDQVSSGRLPPIQDAENSEKKKKRKKRRFKLMAKLPALRGLMARPEMIKQDVLKGAEVPGSVPYSEQILKPARNQGKPQTVLETQAVSDEEVED